MIILICLAFPPLCLLTFFSFTYFTASSSWLPPFLLNYQPLSGVLPSLSSLRLGGTEWRALYSPFKSVFPLAFSLIFLGALNIESIRSFTFSGCWVPCKVHAALQTGTPLKCLSLSFSVSLCLWPVWPLSLSHWGWSKPPRFLCPLPLHMARSCLTEKRLWGGQFLFTSLARLIPTPLFRGQEEPAPSWRPISTCPVCHLGPICSVDLP